ncbi:DUF6412 domain-containing protein [Actinocrispum sp. NPDC049592]|uniref:DUF6412 domain-containing protein n=1 Tax=Actinocrispum sp. NPDC049592 TaxID=3154835 RepID=UPI0034200EAA
MGTFGVRWQLLLAVVLPLAFVLLGFDGSGQFVLVTALTAGLALVLSICLPAPAAAPAQVRGVSLRQRARESVFLRLRDPDASGKPRPRAPSAAFAAV